MDFFKTTAGKITAGVVGVVAVGTVVVLATKKSATPAAASTPTPTPPPVIPVSPPPMPATATSTPYGVTSGQWVSFDIRTSFTWDDPNNTTAPQSVQSILQTLGFANIQVQGLPSDPTLWAVSGQWQGSGNTFSDSPPLWMVIPGTLIASTTQPLQPKQYTVTPNDWVQMLIQTSWVGTDPNALKYLQMMLGSAGFNQASIQANISPQSTATNNLANVIAQYQPTTNASTFTDWPPVAVIENMTDVGTTQPALLTT
jgi:hypothetical protein